MIIDVQNKKSVENLIIIGSGPAAMTAALYAARASLHPIVFEGNRPGGQLMSTTIVENWPGIKSISGPKLMADMKEHAASFGAIFIPEQITKVDFTKSPFTIETKTTTMQSKAVIIATGAYANSLNCPGEQEYWGKGVSTCAICDGAFYPNKKIVIVGGGDTAMETASFMARYTDDITIVHILDSLTASPIMQQRILNNQSIKILYEQTVSAIFGNGTHVTETTIIHKKTGDLKTVAADAVFLAIGQVPSSKIFKEQIELDRFGYIVQKRQTETSVPGIFAVGDVVDYKYKQAIVAAGAGCQAALDAQRYLESIET